MNKRPLSLLAQINMAELPSEAVSELTLPRSGILLFFMDPEEFWGGSPEERDGFRILHVPDGKPLTTAPWPDGLAQEYRFPACSLEFQSQMELPDSSDECLSSMTWTDKESTYFSLIRGKVQEEDETVNKLGGHPDIIQSDMRMDCQLIANGQKLDGKAYEKENVERLSAGLMDWVLLCQIDSDDAASMMWGDAGRVYFWIRREDLKAGNFNNAWATVQCY